MRFVRLTVSVVFSSLALGLGLLFISSSTVQHWQITGLSLVPLMGICNLVALVLYCSCLNLSKTLKKVMFGWITMAGLCLLTGVILAVFRH
ncbi:MAG: hypothetical protein JO316_05295 [Abitibacteriaceae bacterium]|nr:hypothetical protein [Abditibacteriaceae bacterium]